MPHDDTPSANRSRSDVQLLFRDQAGFLAFVSGSGEGGDIHLCRSFACDPYNGFLLHLGHKTVFSPLMF
jgi:hypothetical protein